MMLTPEAIDRLLDPERVWGVEVLDPVEQFEWAQKLWEQLHAPFSFQRPLLLLYEAAAERSAFRVLRRLAHLGRRQALAVFVSTPGDLPLLEPVTSRTSALLLVHRASRFLNLSDWLQVAARPGNHLVLTASVHEAQSLPEIHNFDIQHVPQEEDDYCDSVAKELLQRYYLCDSVRKPDLDIAERVLVEAGLAGVEVPIDLLARYLDIPRDGLVSHLKNDRLKEFIWWTETEAREVFEFRGEWLASKLAPDCEAGNYPQLTALLGFCDLTLAAERNFFFNLLVALRSQTSPLEPAHLPIRETLSILYHQGILTALTALLYLRQTNNRSSFLTNKYLHRPHLRKVIRSKPPQRNGTDLHQKENGGNNGCSSLALKTLLPTESEIPQK